MFFCTVKISLEIANIHLDSYIDLPVTSLHSWCMNARRHAVRLFPFLLYMMYVFITPPLVDDLWWRLHSGQTILQQGSIVDTNEWAYRDAGRKWVNHAAGYDVLLAAIKRLGGMPGVLFPHFLAVFFLGAQLLRPTQRQDFAWALFGVPLLVIHYATRPFLISDVFLYFSVMAAVQAHDQNTLRLHNLWPSYLLFWLWGWLHGSVWVGTALFLLLGVRWQQIWKKPHSEIRRSAPLALIFPCALANPAFLSGLHLAWQYAMGDIPWLTSLTEWQGPQPLVFFFMGAWCASIMLAWKQRKLPLGRLVPLTILLPSAMTQIRHMPLPVIAVGAMFLKLHPIAFFGPKAVPRQKTLFFMLILITGFAASLVHARHLQDPRFVPIGLYHEMIQRCDLEGKKLRIFTLHAWGGSLLYHFGGHLQPYMDARNDCFSQETFDRYHDIINLRGHWYEKIMQDHPDGAVLPSTHPLIPELLRRGWVSGVRWRYNHFLTAPHWGHTLCPLRVFE